MKMTFQSALEAAHVVRLDSSFFVPVHCNESINLRQFYERTVYRKMNALDGRDDANKTRNKTQDKNGVQCSVDCAVRLCAAQDHAR